jgi:beta-lactamase regulating signal transducer with metallopeptidase domain
VSELVALVVSVTAALAVALLAVRVMPRARAAVRHLVLASAFGAVAVLPVATLVSPPVAVEIPVLPPRSAEPSTSVPGDAVAPGEEDVPPAPTTAASTVTERIIIPTATWLLLFWATVAIVALLPLGASLWRFRTIRHRGRPWPEGTARLAMLAREAGVRRPVTLLLHDGMASPITGGLLRPVIVLPADAETWSETYLHNAFVHELAHVRRHDWPLLLVARAVCALYWFHPLAWIAWRGLRLEAERACDDAVLAGGDGAVYAEQLLGLARRLVRGPSTSTLSMASDSDLSSRIAALLDDTRSRGRAGQPATACIVTAACLAIVALAPLRATGPLRQIEEPRRSERAEGSSTSAGTSAGQDLPQRLASRAEAAAGGCRFAAVKGPGVDACVLTGFRDRHLDVSVYERAPDGAYVRSDEMAISSWYEGATLSLVDLLGTGTDWLVIDTEGMRGTGIFQRVLFAIGWDGTRFRTAASESLDYRCSRPTSPADYRLTVRHAFKPLRGATALYLDYELTKDGQRIGLWSDRLRWRAAQFAFAPFEATTGALEPGALRIREQIGYARVYSAVRPLAPGQDDSGRWMGNSGLMDVLSPACAPSLGYVTRPFAGKWMLDADRTAAVNPGGVSPDVALIVGWSRDALTVSRSGGGRDVHRLDGTETSIPVGGATGRAKAVMDDDKMVVTIAVEGRSEPLRRVYYLDGRSLVIEESGGAEGARTMARAYYLKA